MRPSTHASGGAHLFKAQIKITHLTVTVLQSAENPRNPNRHLSTGDSRGIYPVSAERRVCSALRGALIGFRIELQPQNSGGVFTEDQRSRFITYVHLLELLKPCNWRDIRVIGTEQDLLPQPAPRLTN